MFCRIYTDNFEIKLADRKNDLTQIMSLKDQHGGQIIMKKEDYTISRQFPKLISPLSNSQNDSTDGILPYMARANSPVRVTFSPAVSLKQKSRVANQSLMTMFKIRPIRRRDRINVSRFKPPDATLPSLQYISPWMSITKGDISDQKHAFEGQESMFLNSRASTRASSSLPRSVTDLDFTNTEYQPSDVSEYSDSSTTNTATFGENQPQSGQDNVTSGDNHQQQRYNPNDIRSVSAKTQTSERRVTFSEKAIESRFRNVLVSIPRKEDNLKATKEGGQIRKPVGIETDVYNAYLPPRVSEQVVYKMNFGHYNQHSLVDRNKSCSLLSRDGLYYKHIVGDRTVFMRETYPTKPTVYQSDIDQLRFEGHERLMKSAGQVPSHFSIYKDRGSLIRPKGKGMILEEALKRQQRLSKSADINRWQRNKTSIETF